MRVRSCASPSKVCGCDAQPEVGLDGLAGRVADRDVGAHEGGAVALVEPVARPVLLPAEPGDDRGVVDVDGRPRDELDAVPDPSGVPVGSERGHRARSVHRVDHVALDLLDRLGLVRPVRHGQRGVGEVDLDVLGLVPRCVVSHDHDVRAVEVHDVGDVELEGVEHPLVGAEEGAVQPDVGDVVDGAEPQEQALAPQRARHLELAPEPDRAEEVADLGQVPVRRELHLPPGSAVELRAVIAERLAVRLLLERVAPDAVEAHPLPPVVERDHRASATGAGVDPTARTTTGRSLGRLRRSRCRAGRGRRSHRACRRPAGGPRPAAGPRAAPSSSVRRSPT